jgi:hypothetical protein
MDSTLKPIIKLQLLFIGASLGISLLLTYLFGFIAGITLNILIFIGIIFYIRRRQMKALRTFGFSDERVGRGYTNSGVKLKYICLSCNAEFNDSKCRKCGSKMKKPIF